MDIKFHVTKIIDNGGRIDDWAEFVEKLKRQKCDRDLLLQVLVIALNNTHEKSTKQYKKMLVGLANLQSEVSAETARQTYIDANNLDTDCAVVCVYYAQFETQQKRKSEATKIIRNGKMDGRTPKFLIKNAYHNLRDNKFNLFEGIVDPWDDHLYDMTATTTIKSGPHSPSNKASIPLNIHGTSAAKPKMFSVGKPTRSASSLLKVSTPKSPTMEVKEKLGLIDSTYSKAKTRNNSGSGSFQPKRSCSKEKPDDSDEHLYRPTLSPFIKDVQTPRIAQKSAKASYARTPIGFVYNIFASGSSVNVDKKTKQFSDKDKVEDIVASLNFDLQPLDDPFIENLGKTNANRNTGKENKDISRNTNHVDGQDNIFEFDNKKESNVFDGFSSKPPDKLVTGDFMKPNNFSKIPDFDNYKTPVKNFNMDDLLVQRTCPKKTLPPGSTRKPLTEIKIPKSRSETDDQRVTMSKKQKLDFNKGLTTPRDQHKRTSPLERTSGVEGQTGLPSESSIDIRKLDKDLGAETVNTCHSGLTGTLQSLEIENDQNIETVVFYEIDSRNAHHCDRGNDNRTLKNLQSKPRQQFTTDVPKPISDEAVAQSSTSIGNAGYTKSTGQSRKPLSTLSKSVNPVVSTQLSQRPSSTSTDFSQNKQEGRLLVNSSQREYTVLKNPPEKHPLAGITQPPQNMSATVDVQEKFASLSTVKPTQPSLDVKLSQNELIQNGLETLGLNGYNMDTQLKPVPRKAKTITLNNKTYTQIKCIGTGGFCKVYDVKGADGSTYALKKVNLEDSDAFCNLNEIKLLLSLKGNPVIIQLYDWEQTESHLLLLMEKGDCDLGRTLKKFDKVPIDKIKEYWTQMLEAVKVIHEKGIVHADLKPANFLFVGGALKLIDFGISNSLQSNKTSFTRECLLGTLNYMPPEALMPDSSRISRASDVWSLGCMLYLMVFNRTPYQHIKNRVTKQIAIQKGEKINYDGLNDSNLLDCLQGCLKFDKRDRYTIDELLKHPFLN